MSFRPSSRNPSSLSIRPPSPASIPPAVISTPTILNPGNAPSGSGIGLNSPRKATLPPSPTHSPIGGVAWPQGSGQGSYISSPYVGGPPDDRIRNNSLDVPGYGGSREKRLPAPPWITPSSPHRTRGISNASASGGGVGAYDNKLVSSTLSHLPPLPSPSSSSPHFPANTALFHPRPTSPRPTLSASPASASGIVILPDGTTLSRDPDRQNDRHDHISRSAVVDALAHTSPSSPWSVLTVHVLPLFAGSPLKTPIEDLNHLCHSHIVAISQRAAPSRIISVLTQDLREFIASGMLTLRAKFETLEEAKIISRAAEVWSFFWSQVLPYLEGVFLPFTQVKDVPTNTHPTSVTNRPLTVTQPPIPVRHLLLSGFMLHIILPLLPRLVPLISSASLNPTTPELQRILQMSLVLSTQATYSSILPAPGGQSQSQSQNQNSLEKRDEDVRENMEALGKVVRWRMENDEGDTLAEAAHKLQRAQSMLQRRKTRFSRRWETRPRRELGMDVEDDDATPNQSYAGHGVSQATVTDRIPASQSTIIA